MESSGKFTGDNQLIIYSIDGFIREYTDNGFRKYQLDDVPYSFSSLVYLEYDPLNISKFLPTRFKVLCDHEVGACYASGEKREAFFYSTCKYFRKKKLAQRVSSSPELFQTRSHAWADGVKGIAYYPTFKTLGELISYSQSIQVI